MRQKTFTNNQILNGILKRADHLKENEHFATAQNYLSCARSFGSYIRSRGTANARFTFQTVQDYSRYLLNERRVLRNTQSFYLRRSDIRDGYIAYRRHKTGRPLTVRLEPCMQQIITRWSSPTPDTEKASYSFPNSERETNTTKHYYKEQCCSDYVFPIIKSTGARAFTEYQSALSAYNKALKAIAEMAGLTKSGLTKSGRATLSSYTARHTWATQAYHAGIPVSVISEGMGHSTEKVTRIYLAQLTPTIIDRYNHTLLHSIGFR